LTAIPAYFVWHPLTGDDFAQLALVGALGAVGQFCQVRAYATGELMAVAPIDYSRLVFAGIMGFLLFAELPDRYTLVGAAIIVGSTLYIAYRETYLSRTHPCSARGTADRCAPGGRRCAATSFGRVRQ
jgi:drug/metabolite transporter (DMT)-like permease